MTIVIPCLNEAESIVDCVRCASDALTAASLEGEIVVCDNNSNDGSADLAKSAGARVVTELRRGYGQALRTGFDHARGDYIVMLDADLTYEFEAIPRFVEALEAGADLVIGDRMGSLEPGAMRAINRFGNAILGGILELLFQTGVRDPHCGMRAFRRSDLARLDLRSDGMELASEMIIRAKQKGLRIEQIAIEYGQRRGRSKLKPVRDGGRHVFHMLTHSPSAPVIRAGLLLLVASVACGIAVCVGIWNPGAEWRMHVLLAAALSTVLATQVVLLGVCAHGYDQATDDPWFHSAAARFGLFHGLTLGLALTLLGMGIGLFVLFDWRAGDDSRLERDLAVLGGTSVLIGVQLLFAFFLLSVFSMRGPKER